MISSLMGSGTAQPTCRRNEWPKNRMASDRTDRHALIMPGTGYNCDRPLLYYCAMALADAGWFVERLDVDADLSKTPAPRIFSMLSGAVDDWLDGIPRRSSPSSQPRTLVVAKSLSTFIYPHVSRLGVPMALLTPVLSPADFDPTRSVIPVPGEDDYEPGSAPEPLICAGTADPLYRGDRAHRLSGLVHEYPQANHSIEVPGRWRTSASYLDDVVARVENSPNRCDRASRYRALSQFADTLIGSMSGGSGSRSIREPISERLCMADGVAADQPRRVLLKLSGEAFGGGKVGIDTQVIRRIAEEIVPAVRQGVQVAIVVGGGNFFRGAELQQAGIDRSRGDYMGMLGTVMNCLALQDFLEQEGQATRVQTAITMGQVAEPYIPLKAIRHLEKGRVVIFGAGAGMPYFSTDTVSIQRSLEIHCDEVVMGKNGVDGVYTSDPRKDADAKRFATLSYNRALVDNLAVMDAAALSMARDNRKRIRVFGLEEAGNVTRALLGEEIGTLVSTAESTLA